MIPDEDEAGIIGLTTAEGVELAAALALWVAHANAIRAVLIKGPVLAHHELRAPRVSADVDVLVDPDDRKQFVRALMGRGWEVREQTFASEVLTEHSVTMIHADWPCDIDVHDRYPGLLEDRQKAFETIWRTRVPLVLAGRTTQVAGFAASAIILALHSLRARPGAVRESVELENLITTAARWTPSQRAEVADIAQELGAVSTLGHTLLDIAEPRVSLASELNNPELRSWLVRRESGADGLQLWLSAFLSSPLKSRPLLLIRGLWPSARDIVLEHPTAESFSRLQLVVYRGKRLIRGLRKAPRALLIRRRNR